MEFEEEFNKLRKEMMERIHAEIITFLDKVLLILPENKEGEVYSFRDSF